jgi:hypothetical protein
MATATIYNRKRLLLMCVATDKTWRWHEGRWLGKCIHCNRKLTLTHDGISEGNATLEHILPRTHQGTNALNNFSIACGRCNHQKGRTIDVLRASDPRLCAVSDPLMRSQFSLGLSSANSSEG